MPRHINTAAFEGPNAAISGRRYADPAPQVRTASPGYVYGYSIPPFGCLHRIMRLYDIEHPFMKPYFFSTNMLYSEQVGSKRHDCLSDFGAKYL